VVAPDGIVWFTGNRSGRLVKLDPASRKLTNYPMPDPKVDDPHTMVLDASGNAWFTAQNSEVVGRLDAKSGKIRLWETGSGTRPYGIEVDAKQSPWYVLFGTNQVGTIDPATMKERRFELPDGARPRRIVVAKDAIWYGDYARGYLGRLDPATGKVTEFALPAGAGSLPYAMAGDDKGKIWLAETGVRPNRLVAFDPAAGQFTDSVATEGDEEPNTIRHMVFHQSSREIWYGTDRNTVGRLRVP
jgi:virginiamycin B lyase